MNLSQFVNGKLEQIMEFKAYMNGHIPPEVVMAEYGWENALKVWASMKEGGIAEEEINAVMRSLLGGWFVEK